MSSCILIEKEEFDKKSNKALQRGKKYNKEMGIKGETYYFEEDDLHNFGVEEMGFDPDTEKLSISISCDLGYISIEGEILPEVYLDVLKGAINKMNKVKTVLEATK